MDGKETEIKCEIDERLIDWFPRSISTAIAETLQFGSFNVFQSESGER
jgi:hypothetical protein